MNRSLGFILKVIVASAGIAFLLKGLGWVFFPSPSPRAAIAAVSLPPLVLGSILGWRWWRQE